MDTMVDLAQCLEVRHRSVQVAVELQRSKVVALD